MSFHAPPRFVEPAESRTQEVPIETWERYKGAIFDDFVVEALSVESIKRRYEHKIV
jgi:hypothetical protein